MADGEQTGASEHETYPGPGPLRTDDGKRSIRPVEQMVDAAIDRIAREREASGGVTPFPTGVENHALVLSSAGGAPTALAPARRRADRLRWKGMEVSEEFRAYAERVARGEDLPPFKGKILAEPDLEFPWEPAAPQRPAGVPLRQQVAVWTGGTLLTALAAWLIAAGFGGDRTPLERGESPLGTAILSSQPKSVEEPVLESPAPPAPSEPAALALDISAALAEVPPSETAPAGALPKPAAPARSTSPSPAPVVPVAAAPKAAVASVPASLGTFVATHAPASELPASAAAASPAAASVATANELASPSISSVALAAPLAGDSSASSGTPLDSKKEPGVESSAMGSLLVETPSF